MPTHTASTHHALVIVTLITALSAGAVLGGVIVFVIVNGGQL